MTRTASGDDDKGIDLVALSRELPLKYEDIARQIVGLRDAHSCRADLVLAQDMIGSLVDMATEINVASTGSQVQNSRLALLYTAIILYVRATKSSSRVRRTAQLAHRFTNEEKAVHKVICDLRDDAIAHFGAGKSYTGPKLREEGVFILPNRRGVGQVASISRTLLGDRDLVATLQKQICAAVLYVDRDTQERNSQLVDRMNALANHDGDFVQIVQSCGGTLAKFLGSEQAARQILDSPRVGSARGSYKHEPTV